MARCSQLAGGMKWRPFFSSPYLFSIFFFRVQDGRGARPAPGRASSPFPILFPLSRRKRVLFEFLQGLGQPSIHFFDFTDFFIYFIF